MEMNLPKVTALKNEMRKFLNNDSLNQAGRRVSISNINAPSYDMHSY